MRPPWSEFRAALDAAGFRPSRRLGQNFLLDDNMVRAIARDAELAAGDFALEVGAGCGFLTAELASLGVELLSVEIDPRLLEISRRFLAPFENVAFHGGDVLDGKHALAPEVLACLDERGAPWHAVGNLPYAVASPLLCVLTRLACPPQSITALVQTEVAERVVAAPGSKRRGTLSARIEPIYESEILRSVPAQLFWPRPRVESAVVRLVLRAEPPGREELARLDSLVDRLFSTRRKGLRAILARELREPDRAEALLERLGLDPRARPEALTQHDLGLLAGSPEWAGQHPARDLRKGR